ncbi:MAG TPA: MmgE/PrpD family protein [Desulfobacteraceae bacterium]|nr:MmgE/PrpD family protein [Desulfobacteraceae bacterium]
MYLLRRYDKQSQLLSDMTKKHDGVTRRIAEFASNLSYESIPGDVIEYTKTLILDQLGVIFAAYGTRVHHVCQGVIDLSFGPGEAPVWGSNMKYVLPGAVLHNSQLGSALDLDDGHRLALGHPGAAIIPVALTVAETRHKPGKALIEAIIAGYEVAIRTSMARDAEKLENVSTGAWGGFGAGIASGKLILGSLEELENILGLVSMYSPAIPGYLPEGRQMVKEGIPWSAMVGVQATLLTEAGFQGPQKVFDDLKTYSSDKLTHELGRVFLIKDTYIKQYSCCRWLHPIVLLCHSLVQESDLNVNEIIEVRVKTFSRALRLSNIITPQTIEDAQFSVPFCTALALSKGENALHLIDPQHLKDPEILRLSHRVTLHGDEEVEAAFPEKVGAKVEIETRKKVFSNALIRPIRGDAGNVFSRKEVKSKYLRYTEPVIGGHRAKNLFEFIENIEDFSSVKLSKLMGLNK